MILRISALTLALVTGSLACSSSPSSPEDAGSPAPDSSTAATPDSSTPATTSDSSTPAADAGALSFSTDIYAPIIAKDCVGCHGGTGPGVMYGKLDMSSVDAGYANLVNVAASGVACGDAGAAARMRVVPGSASTSLLYAKVDGFTTPPPCGHPMPESGEIGDGGQAAVVQQIEAWIDEGALP